MSILEQPLNQKSVLEAKDKNNSSIFHDEQEALSHKSFIKQKPGKTPYASIYKGEDIIEVSADDSEEGNNNSAKRTCMDKWFGKMETGSIRASILTIISSMIGVGFLTLPIVGKNSGYIICAVFI